MKRASFLLPLMLIAFSASAQYGRTFENGEQIPDYSRVGYRWSDRDIPKVGNDIVLQAPSDGSDATALIQDALDKAHGAVLLKAGVYRVGGTLNIRRDGVVLRGEGPDTRVMATGTEQRVLLTIGNRECRREEIGKRVEITEDAPMGQLWVKVAKASSFKKGDRVLIGWDATREWIHDLKMDSIQERQGSGAKTTQWTPNSYRLRWERTVIGVENDKVILDNPVIMALTSRYGRGFLVKCNSDRVSESGVEDIYFESEYDPSAKDPKTGYCNDEKHAWDAVVMRGAENCWAVGVTSRYFGHGCVNMNSLAKNCTAMNCVSHEPVSIITGGRRYAFCVSNAELCLYEGCECDNDRHQFVSGSRTGGPNVFHNCRATDSFSDAGPHHRWATGILYDCVNVDRDINIQDRQHMGSGHGWAGANLILWNCEAGHGIVCQSPWVSAKNYAVGCIGPKMPGAFNKDGSRPDGVWEHYGEHVTPLSLFDWQLEQRHKSGVDIDAILSK